MSAVKSSAVFGAAILLTSGILVASCSEAGSSSATDAGSGTDARVTDSSTPTDGGTSVPEGGADAADARVDAPADSGEAGTTICGNRQSCVVFVTNATMPSGNLVAIADAGITPDAGAGVLAADTICRAAAGAAGLPGTFKAWISDHSGRSPSTTFSRPTVPYRLVDGTMIAASYNALVTSDGGAILAPINKTQTDAAVMGAPWTGTLANGLPNANPTQDCNEWTNGTASFDGWNGDTSATGPQWTYAGGQKCNNPFSQEFRLLCFEQ